MRGATLKAELRTLLRAGDIDGVVAMADGTHRVLGTLIAFTYDPDPDVAWRAVDALGATADRIARDDPDVVRRYLRRLFWLITEESGGICWFAPQAMAEIARTHEAFADFVPIVVNLLGEMAAEDLEHFRPGILWAIGRLGPLAAPHMDDVVGEVEAALGHPDANVRGLAVWALGRTGRGDRAAAQPRLLDDRGEVRLFEGGELGMTSVAELARRATAT